MSLPPGFLDELRNRISIAQVVGRKVMWDSRKSNQAKGDLWAPCPFHQEKTASFHVDDRKGFYYCFGCQAKGDALGFVQQTENVGFMEAVEILAREAGMAMPARDPEAAQKSDRATRLAAAMEAAVAHYRLQLKTAAAAEARAYIARRGLDAGALERFEIGFAPAARQGAFAALTGKGIAAEDVIEAGIATQPDDGGPPYDAFRDRIMFPIRDARGRCIGFGGRAMAADARAKYLNSRETPLFDKGRALYNHGPAREAAGKGAPLIVAEGYMDVIALVQAGFGAAVAPLGTAITQDQLRLMWRIADEPIIALDGDKAGLRAALRLVDLALPLLEPGKTLRFCLLPEGQVFDTPERRAALDGRLRQAIARIPDPGLRRHYGEALAELRRALFRPAPQAFERRAPWRKGGVAEVAMALAETRTSALGSGALSADELRIMVIVATLCRYPALVESFETDLERLAPRDPDHAGLVRLLLTTQALDAEGIEAACAAAGLASALESLRRTAHLRITPILAGAPDPEKARLCLEEEFRKVQAQRAIENEMVEGLEDLGLVGEGDPQLARRINEASRKRQTQTTARAQAAGEQFGDTREMRTAFHELLTRVNPVNKGT